MPTWMDLLNAVGSCNETGANCLCNHTLSSYDFKLTFLFSSRSSLLFHILLMLFILNFRDCFIIHSIQHFVLQINKREGSDTNSFSKSLI